MGLDMSSKQAAKRHLIQHVGHEIQISNYGRMDDVTIECFTCSEVLISADDFPNEKKQSKKQSKKKT